MQHPPEHTRPAMPRRTLRQAFNLAYPEVWQPCVTCSRSSCWLCCSYCTVWRCSTTSVLTSRRRSDFTAGRAERQAAARACSILSKSSASDLAERDREAFTDLIKQYTQHTDKLSYEVIDPDRQPALAKQYDITAYNTVVGRGQWQERKRSPAWKKPP